MSDATKQLTPEQLLEKFRELYEFSQSHQEHWRNEVADDLNELIGRAVFVLETSCDDVDLSFGNAVLRIIERVADFEDIETIERPKS